MLTPLLRPGANPLKRPKLGVLEIHWTKASFADCHDVTSKASDLDSGNLESSTESKSRQDEGSGSLWEAGSWNC